MSLTWLIFTDVCLDDLIIEPHVRDRHAVLRQCAILVWADCRSRAQSFYRLEVLHQTVLACHSLSSQRQTHLEYTRRRYQSRLIKLQFTLICRKNLITVWLPAGASIPPQHQRRKLPPFPPSLLHLPPLFPSLPSLFPFPLLPLFPPFPFPCREAAPWNRLGGLGER